MALASRVWRRGVVRLRGPAPSRIRWHASLGVVVGTQVHKAAGWELFALNGFGDGLGGRAGHVKKNNIRIPYEIIWQR